MKVAAAAALAAALILGLAVSGVFGRTASVPPTDTIRLESGPATPPATVPTTPSPTHSDDPERVHMRVKEEQFDDKGGERRDAESAREDGNSGSGSANSGSGSGNDDD